MTKKTNNIPPDQEARDFIQRELDRTIHVEAAAGTGKTTSMANRMTALIRERKCAIESLAAVTFTRKAAAELRARFQLALEMELRRMEGKNAVLAEAVQNAERCFIGTIHSFCARLLRERPIEAGVDLGFEEMEEEADARLREQAWDEYAVSLYVEGDGILEELDSLGLQIGQLKQAFLRFADFPDVEEWPTERPPLPDLQEIIAGLQEYAARMENLADALPADPGHDTLIPKYKTIPRLMRYADPARLADWMAILEEFKDIKIVQKNWPGKKEQAKAEEERWTIFCETFAQPRLDAWRIRRYEAAMRALQPAIEIYERRRREMGALNFQDLLLLSARLLRDRPAIRRYFRERFTHLLVDEFQDTDPIQAEVMMLLTADDPTQEDWRQCKPVPGSLFVVGDPKQSIYRFRRADIATYNQVKEIIRQAGGGVLTLSANFRTDAPILDWVNRCFQEHFPPTADEFSPAYVPLQAGKGESSGADDLVRRLDIPEDYDKQEDVQNYEADFIARTIRAALNASSAQPGDFLVITRLTKRMNDYGVKLQELGIPHEITGSAGLNEIPELACLREVLTAICQPKNPVALLAVLRGPLFGASDAALFALKKAGGKFSFRAPLPDGLGNEERNLFADAFGKLRQYSQWTATLPLVSAIEKIADDLGLFALAAAAPDGHLRAGSLAKAIELLRLRQAPMASIEEAAIYLNDLVNQKECYDGLSICPSESGAVRIMNLHKVKGLEAPCVFLADPNGNAKHDVQLHVDRSGKRSRGYMAIYEETTRWGTGPLLAHPSGWSEIAKREKQFLEAEEMRLLYVAATRAGKQLTISQRMKKNHVNPWKFFDEYLKNTPTLPDPGPQHAPVLAGKTVTANDALHAAAAIQEKWQTAAYPTYAVERAKQVSQNWPVSANETSERGAQWGSAVHLLLQELMDDPAADLNQLARTVLAEEELEENWLDELKDAVLSVTRSEIWRRAQASRQRMTEVPFETMVHAGKELPTLQRGVIDLVFLEANGWVIVDYKTDRGAITALDRLAEHYRPQVEAYAARWREITGQRVAEAGLYFTAAGKYVCVFP
ncbi:MAG: UvrD-helicase domain-containing protein [Candidatus Omnitrophota bacterium]